MNSIWNKNTAFLKERFPQLYSLMEDAIKSFDSGKVLASYGIEAEQTKNGLTTLKQNKVYLHSRYNPLREAEQCVASFSTTKDAASFLGFGLGYVPVAFARKNPSKTLILIESDLDFFLLALYFTDFEDVFKIKNLLLFVGADTGDVAFFLHRYRENQIEHYIFSAQISHNPSYYQKLVNQIKQNNQADQVNTNTLEKFSYLWMKNSIFNLNQMAKLEGVERYFSKGRDLPFLILAAGPSLEKILPYISELKKRCVLVAVDTALHALLRSGTEPDFIILTDPQYYCAMHLEFLKSPSSILITESAAWPSVFRFECREIILCASMFPIGKYFESKLGSKGRLGAGGSVTTTAWDFARKCGAKDIYIAGMDLGFPGKQTHVRGSQFEEKAHIISTRIKPAESFSTDSLISANPTTVKDYDGNDLLTDQRMTVFAWWFKESCLQAMKLGQTTWTITTESCAIEGIQKSSVQKLLDLGEIKKEKHDFINTKSEAQKPSVSYEEVKKDFTNSLEELQRLSKKGLGLCQKALENRTKAAEIFVELKEIDSAIMSSSSKDAASLVFPTERQLEELTKNLSGDSTTKSLQYSRIIYIELSRAVRSYLSILRNI